MTLLPMARLQVLSLESTLHMPFHISQGVVEKVTNVLIQIEDVQGNIAIGEAAPFPVLTGDTQEIAMKAAREICDQLMNETPASALEKLHYPLWQEFRYAPSARTGVEMALWDLYARQLGCPLWMLWGRAGLKGATTDITLPRLSSADVESFWVHFSQHGFPYVKVKVGGGSVADDVERILALLDCAERTPTFASSLSKSRIPSQKQSQTQRLLLSLDGNQGFTVDSAKRLVFELMSRKIEPLFFEQPLPEDDFHGMTRLTESLPIPVCADETVKTFADAVKVINDKCAQMINLKFMKSGIRESLLIAEAAHRFSIPLMIGGMVESEIAMTASLHAVCGTGSIAWCDLDTPFFLQKRVTKESPYHRAQAYLILPSGPGIGLSLN